MTEFDEAIRRNLENDWGPAAQHSDWGPGDQLRYTADGSTWTGVIVWVVGQGESQVEGRDPLPMHYVVERVGWEGSIPDVVYSKDILTGEPHV